MDDRQYNNRSILGSETSESEARGGEMRGNEGRGGESHRDEGYDHYGRKPKRRVPWIRMALIFIFLGGILFATGWASGSRGGNIYFQGGGLHINTAHYSDEESTTFNLPRNAQGFNYVSVFTTSMNISVHVTNGEPHWVIHGDIEPVINTANNQLTIDTRQEEQRLNFRRGWQIFMFSSSNWEIELHLPREMMQSALHLRSVSGSIRVDGVESASFNATTTSGSVRLNNASVTHAEMQSVSGSISVAHSHVVQGAMTTASGSISVTNGSIQHFTATTASGSINVDTTANRNGSALLNTMSGSIRFTGHGLARQSDNVQYHLQTISGSIRVDGQRLSGNVHTSGNAANPWFFIHAQTMSGSVRLDFE